MPPTTRLIAFSGYARSGKDSAATSLLATDWVRKSFADKLREFLIRLNPTLGPVTADGANVALATYIAAVGWERAKDEHPEIRPLLQRCGTEAGRGVLGDNVWVDAVFRDITSGQRVVFTDCRFPNEAEAVRERGGLVVRVNRPGVGPAIGGDGLVHPSETALDSYPFDHTLLNDGSLADLQAMVMSLIFQPATQAA